MGDEVKITVIATGFKQNISERRARMLDEATTTPGRSGFAGGYEVPIRPRPNQEPLAAAPSAAPFASELKRPEPVPQAEPGEEPEAMEVAAAEQPAFASSLYAALDELETMEAKTPVANAGNEPELVPVPASVFDDESFRTTYVRRQQAEREAMSGIAVAARPVADEEARVDLSGEVESFEYASVAPGKAARMFAGADAGNHFRGPSAQETDELDIPAFLRKVPRS